MKNPFRAPLCGFDFVFGDRIQFMRPDHWDAVTDNHSFFIGREFLSLMERCGPREMSHRYALVYSGTRPVAAIAAQILPVSGEQLVSAAAFGMKRRRALTHLRERVFMVGNVFSWGPHGVAFAPGADEASLWPAVSEAIYRIRRAEKLSGPTDVVLIKDIPESHSGAAALRRFEYRPLRTEPNMVLALSAEWKTYEDYLNSLTAKYRRSQRAVHETLEAAGVTVEVTQDLSPWMASVNQLYGDIVANASVRLALLPADFLRELGQAAPAHFCAILLKKEGRLLGFVTVIRDGETAVGYYIGFDRTFSVKASLYVRLLHGVIEQAIAWRCARVSFGRTALEPKAALGAKPQNMVVWMKHANPLLNLAVRNLVTRIPHAEAPERNPFKADAA